MPGKSDYLGSLEEQVLLAIQALQDNAYGVTIQEQLAERAGRALSIGSLYVTLGRLEDKGLVRSWQGEPTAERGGRAKRFFEVTAEGFRLMEQAEIARVRLRTGLAGGAA